MNKTLIIAEAGVNHNGSMEIAKKLVDLAAKAGADYVKFQTFRTDKVVSKSAKKADYQVRSTGIDESQYEMIKKLELSKEMHHILIDHCKLKGIKFLSTAFDHDSIDLLDELNLDFFKIPSGEITNLPYLLKIASKKKPIVMSSGMANLGEIEDALNVLYNEGISKDEITVLHCNTEYPTPMQDVNLRAMNTIAKAFKVKSGYSDHTLGIHIPIAAVARGATCIEKHFTLDRNMAGPDHKASLEPDELIEMVRCIRSVEKALGNGIKKPSISEEKNISIARKSIHTSRPLKVGDTISADDLIMKRPGTGISPMNIDMVIGAVALEDIDEDTLLSFNNIVLCE